MAALMFGGAGTFDWWQAWLYLAVYFGASLAITLYLVRKDPALLARRMRGGPWAEKQPAQQVIMVFASVAFIGLTRAARARQAVRLVAHCRPRSRSRATCW